MCAVAELKNDSWLKRKIPMKKDLHIKQMVLADFEELGNLKKNRNNTFEKANANREAFKDAAHQDAVEIIMKDRIRNNEARKEDIAFLD